MAAENPSPARMPPRLADALLADLNPEQRAAARTATARCSSSRAPAPARPPPSPTASPTSSRAAPSPAASCCSPSPAGPRARCCAASTACCARRPRTADRSSPGAQVWGGTFHAIAARLLRIHARDVGLEPDFTIMDRGDSEDLMHLCRTELGLGRGSSRFPQKSTCLDIYSRCVNAQTPLAEVLARAFPWCTRAEDDLKRLFTLYTDKKEAQQVLDYDDLLLFWHGCSPTPSRASGSASASTTCSSTSTRTPTSSRPRSSRCCAPTAPA